MRVVSPQYNAAFVQYLSRGLPWLMESASWEFGQLGDPSWFP